jgi:hypothetical protein
LAVTCRFAGVVKGYVCWRQLAITIMTATAPATCGASGLVG